MVAGASVGLWYTVEIVPLLVERFALTGALLASPTGIGLGLLVALFTALFGRLTEVSGSLSFKNVS